MRRGVTNTRGPGSPDDLSPASQYSVSEEEGIKRLRIRTGRGRTVTFKPLVAGVESVLDVEWHLSAFVTVSEWGGPDVVPLRVDRLIPGTEVTAGFHESGVAGFGGCNSYGARLEPEEARGGGKMGPSQWALSLLSRPIGFVVTRPAFLSRRNALRDLFLSSSVISPHFPYG